ncbi:MAG: GNAT family N-acetyltransferase [Cyanobacteria bacterium J06621_8]
MNTEQNLIIRKAVPSEDIIIAEHFYQLWLDNHVSPEDIKDDWLEDMLQFIAKARQELSFQAFVALVGNEIVGSVSCQLFAGLYPMPFKPSIRKYGYIWNVFVKSTHRRRGIATELTRQAIAYLKSSGCTHVILHASPYGKPVYSKLGFVDHNEMILDIG